MTHIIEDSEQGIKGGTHVANRAERGDGCGLLVRIHMLCGMGGVLPWIVYS